MGVIGNGAHRPQRCCSTCPALAAACCLRPVPERRGEEDRRVCAAGDPAGRKRCLSPLHTNATERRITTCIDAEAFASMKPGADHREHRPRQS
ncbi:MAG: hypothetical protein ACLVJH_12075 [Faecalibacterium prausnitzii]